MDIEIDVEGLTLDEAVEFENITGMLVEDVDWGGRVPKKVYLALAYIFGKRKNPDFTLKDAGSIKITELNFVTPNPTENAG